MVGSMLPLTKLVRTVGGGFRRKKVVQTVTWLCDLPKKFAIRLVNESSMSNAVSVSPRRMAFLHRASKNDRDSTL